MKDRESFALASRAFSLFTLEEQERALTRFARLKFPSISDRFIDAVHFVITQKDGHASSTGEPT